MPTTAGNGPNSGQLCCNKCFNGGSPRNKLTLVDKQEANKWIKAVNAWIAVSSMENPKSMA